MPTIDQLAPATAASDTDELLASQSGIARKVTRAQMVAGLQPELALASGTLLGRSSSGSGAPEQLAVGANLVLAGGTLTASAAPYQVALLAAGTVPSATDLVPLGQDGTNTAVPYAQFMAGLPGVANLNASGMLVTPTGAAVGQSLANFAAGTLAKSGGSMTGPLTLAGNPTVALQAAPKQYVDSQTATALPLSGGTLTGPLTLTSNPASSLQAATKQYVDSGIATALPLGGGTLTGSLLAPSLTATGNVTVGGKLSPGALALTQTGTQTGTLAAQIVLQRIGSGPSDAPILNSNLTVTHSGGAPLTYSNAQFTTTVNDAVNSSGLLIDGTTSDVRALVSSLNVNAVTGSVASPTASQHVAITASATKSAPVGGYPSGRIGAQVWGLSLPVSDTTNQPSSISNSTVGVAMNLAANNLDPIGRRFGYQATLAEAVPLSSGGAPTEWACGLAFSTSATSFYKQQILASGNYSIAVLDTRNAVGGVSKVTTSLSAPSTTIAVDPVLPFTSAGISGQPVSAGNTAQVQVGANVYTQIGVALDGGGKTSGTLTFAAPISVADGSAGNLIQGASRAIWLGTGQQIAFDYAGASNIYYDTRITSLRMTAPLRVDGQLNAAAGIICATATISGAASFGAGIQCGGTVNATGGFVGSNLTLSGNIAASGNLSVGSSSAPGSLTVSGQTTFQGNVSSSGTLSAAGGFTGSNVTLTGNLVASGYCISSRAACRARWADCQQRDGGASLLHCCRAPDGIGRNAGLCHKWAQARRSCGVRDRSSRVGYWVQAVALRFERLPDSGLTHRFHFVDND